MMIYQKEQLLTNSRYLQRLVDVQFSSMNMMYFDREICLQNSYFINHIKLSDYNIYPYLKMQIKDLSEDQQRQAQDLFNQASKQAPQLNSQQQANRQPQSPKRSRRDKHSKKGKKHRHRHQQQEQESESGQRNQYGEMFEDQASEHSDQEDGIDDEAELLNNADERERYARHLSNRRGDEEAILNRVEGKSQKEIEEMYKRKLHQRRENQVLVPSSYDHQTYSVQCKMGKEEEVVFSILQKTFHYRKTSNPKFKIEITSAMSLKKKYPGKVFIEAENQSAIRQGLYGFIDVNSKKVTKLQHEEYINLFVKQESEKVQFKNEDYIRIKKGVYQNDLGKIVKMNKYTADVLLVPRVNVQEILLKIKEHCSKLTDQKAIQDKKEEILKRFINPKTYYPSNLRPAKKFFENEDPFTDVDVPYVQRIHIQKGGMIELSFRLDDLKKVQQGSILPVQIAPFNQDGRMFEQLKQQKINTVITFQKGEQAEIIAGQLAGYFGTVEQVFQHSAKIKCRTKGMQGQIFTQPLQQLAKRFKEGQRVKVTSGTDQGKTGIILKLQGRTAQIWTDNQNSIKINKNNLERYTGQVINQQNVHGLRRDDLIKTSKNIVGVVLSTTKDNIKILDMNNTIQIISNMDFDSRINSQILLTKNRNNEQIRNNSIVRIRNGLNDGLRCTVKHVYKDYVFLFNPALDKRSGMTVEKADNCAVLAKTAEGMNRKNTFAPKPNTRPEYDNQVSTVEDSFKVGKSIVISTGPLKGYKGIIKSINKDRIEVRVPQKSTTEWITRNNLVTSNNDTMEIGKTPRRMGMSTYQQGGMSPNNYN